MWGSSKCWDKVLIFKSSIVANKVNTGAVFFLLPKEVEISDTSQDLGFDKQASYHTFIWRKKLLLLSKKESSAHFMYPIFFK